MPINDLEKANKKIETLLEKNAELQAKLDMIEDDLRFLENFMIDGFVCWSLLTKEYMYECQEHLRSLRILIYGDTIKPNTKL